MRREFQIDIFCLGAEFPAEQASTYDGGQRPYLISGFHSRRVWPIRSAKMNAHQSIVDHYLAEFRAGRCDDAFHSLIEADSAVISDLIKAYEDTTDLDSKVFLIEVISEFRLDSSLVFLRHALRRDEPQIWKAALNGMAMAGSPEAVDAMDHVLSSVQDSDKREWIEEAITDTNIAIMKKAEQAAS